MPLWLYDRILARSIPSTGVPIIPIPRLFTLLFNFNKYVRNDDNNANVNEVTESGFTKSHRVTTVRTTNIRVRRLAVRNTACKS